MDRIRRNTFASLYYTHTSYMQHCQLSSYPNRLRIYRNENYCSVKSRVTSPWVMGHISLSVCRFCSREICNWCWCSAHFYLFNLNVVVTWSRETMASAHWKPILSFVMSSNSLFHVEIRIEHETMCVCVCVCCKSILFSSLQWISCINGWRPSIYY